MALHAALLLGVAVNIPWQGRSGGRGDGDNILGFFSGTGDVGLPGSPGDGSDAEEESGAGPVIRQTSLPQIGSNELKLDDTPPVELELPVAAVPMGVARPSTSPVAETNPRGLPKSSRRLAGGPGGTDAGSGTKGGGRPGAGTGDGFGVGDGSGGGGSRGIPFFGVEETGYRFVYVLDASGSMYDHNAIGVAKAELLASLEQLDENQQFQVIFYNERPYPLVVQGAEQQLYRGNSTNRMIAAQFIRSVQPDAGTKHLDALLLALSYNPNVVFFLTDAGLPNLDAKDLDTIKRKNNGRARIHTIEFGKLAPLRGDNFLKKLARENGGTATYHDVTQFQKD